MPTLLQIRLLGGLQLLLDGAPVGGLVSNKAAALVAYLAVTARTHQREALTALFWAELPEADARNNLRQVLTSLRKPLEPFLEVTRETVALRPGGAWRADVHAFADALRAGKLQESAHLRQAADLYTGDFLEGVFLRDAPEFEEWMLAQRVRYRELALHTLHLLTEAYLERAGYTEAIDCATRLLVLDPWREEAYVQLMLALARTGQRSAALAQYKVCCHMLQEVFGAEPAQATSTLYTRIRAAANRPRHNLPAPATDFVGRQAEVAHLRQLLAARTCRLVSLVGPGGAGKTRLAIEVASNSEAMFLDGVCYLSLATVDRSRPQAILPALAEALQLALASAEQRKQIFDYLRSKELLLLLDNVEHLVEHLGWLGDLLASAPGVKVLATTRQRLDLQAEHVLQVEGMGTPAPGDAAPEQHAAVELFVRCAQRVEADFALTPALAPVVAHICRLVGGLPLGIELAAALAAHLPCAEIAAAIAANLDALASSRRDVAPRQRSLRAVFDHSWQLLAADEAEAFCRLAVFRGGFTRAAAGGIGNGQRVLAALVGKSLVRKNGDDRYDLHEVLQQYAAEQLALTPALAAQTAAGHARYFAGFLTDHAEWLGGSRQVDAITTISGEIDNLRGAWQWALGNDLWQVLAPMADPLFRFYEIRSLTQEGAERFGEAIAAVHSAEMPPAQRHALLGRLMPRQARLLARSGQRTASKARLEEVLSLPEADVDPIDRALALNYRGMSAQYAGDYGEAVAYFVRSQALSQANGDVRGVARALNSHGVVALFAGELDEAEPLLQAALASYRELGDAKATADALNNLGILLHEARRYAEETALLEEALTTYRQLDDLRGIATCLHNLGGVHLARCEMEAARHYFYASYAQHEGYGDRDGMAGALNNLATVALRAADAEEARRQLLPALRMAQATDNVPLQLDVLVGAAEWMILCGVPERALALLQLCLTHAQDSDTLAEAERLAALAQGRAGRDPFPGGGEALSIVEAVDLALRCLAQV